MTENSNYHKIHELRQQQTGISQEQRQLQCKEILGSSIKTKIRTSFIFPIAEFERVFGYLWGHEIEDKSQLNENQMLFHRMFQEIRKSILDNGNTQIRAIDKELVGYVFDVSKQTVILKPLKEGNNG